MENINSDALIPLVKERRVLWDKTLQIYKNKQLTMTAWREIFGLLNPNFGVLQQKERHEFGKMVVKRWTHIRDSWMKSYKKHKDRKKSGSSKKSPRPYIYYEQMSFLKKITEIRTKHKADDTTKMLNIDTDEDRPDIEVSTQEFPLPNQCIQADKIPKIEIDTDQPNIGIVSEQSLLPPQSTHTDKMPKLEADTFDPNIEINSQNSLLREIKRKKVNPMDSRMMQFLYSRLKADDNNRHLSFFRGILPSLDTFNDDDTLEFQAGILSLIQNIKRKQQQQYYSPVFAHPNLNFNVNEWQHRPGLLTRHSQQNLNQSTDSVPSTSGYFTQQLNRSMNTPFRSPESASTDESSVEFNFEDEVL